MNDVVSTPLSSAPPDTAALAWVLEQVRDNLLGALAAVRRQAQLSGLEAAQAEATSALLQARTHVHQAAGALELLGQAGTARVLHTAERVLMSALEQPQRLDAPMIEALESALHAALDYLEARANGRDESAVKLFRQYRGLADLAGGEQPHPVDLWDLAWSWPQPPDDCGAPRPLGTQARSDYERALLDVLRAGNLRNAGSIMQAVARQARNAAQGDERALWWIAEAFFAGLGDELLDTDIYVKRLCNRLNLQLRQMLAGQSQVSQRLGHELAFFCEQALSQAGARGRQAPPVLRAVGQALGLRPHEVIDWQRPHFGLVDPALVQQARKRMLQVKDGWSHIGNGDFSRIARLQENLQQFGLLIRQLCTGAEVLPAAVERLVALVGEQHSKLTPERVLEVATALLFLEASLVHFRADDADFLPRARELAQRLQRSAEGYASEAFAPWMEALYRKVSETQTLGTVVQELRHDMGTVEHVLDGYFRDPRALAELEPVPRLLGQMRGVLSVLGMDVGAQALGHIRHSVENLMAAPPQPAVARQPGGPFDRLAANIGALGFMVDMLGYQPELAKASFQFDAQKGELRPVVPHARQTAPALPPETRGDEAPAAPAAAEPTAAAPLPSPEAAAAEAPAPEAPHIPAPPASTHAGGAEDLALPSLEEADTLVPQPEPEAPAGADTVPAALDLEPPSTGGEPDLDALLAPPPAAVAADDEAVDPELLEIFLDEADEVVAEGRARVGDLRSTEPADDSLTALRRCFHTLKGSSRMVGMRDFGEAAWALEQAFNKQLAEGGPAPQPLLDLAEHTLERLQAWAHALREGDASAHSSTELVEAARRLNDTQPGTPAQAVAATAMSPSALPLHEPAMPHLPDLPAAQPAELPEAQPQGIGQVDELSLDSLLLGTGLETTSAAPHAPQAIEQAAEQAPPFEQAPAVEAPSLEAPSLEAPSLEAPFLEEPDLEAPSLQAPPVEPPQWAAPAWPDASLLDLGSGVDAGAVSPQPGEDAAASLLDAAQEPPAAPQVLFETTPDHQPGMFEQEPAAQPANDESLHAPQAGHEAAEEQPATGEAEAPVAEPAPGTAEPLAAESAPAGEPARDADRLGIPQALQAIYLNEADELLRRLDQSLSAWAMLPQLPIGAEAEAHAHQLRGSSATVGLHGVQQLAGLLEQAIQVQNSRPLELSEDERALLPQAVEQMRGLLHQFAAGFVREPQPETIEALHSLVLRLEGLPAPAPTGVEVVEALPGEELEATADWPWAAARVPQPAAEPERGAQPEPGLDAELDSSLEPAREAAAPESWAAADSSGELDVDAVSPDAMPAPGPTPLSTPDATSAALPQVRDSIDADLFPIFEFEAAELLPQLGSALRQWEERPGDSAAPRQAMRLLHTFKGSARMAGTMLLGDMAHALESDIETLIGAETRPAEQALAELTTRFDALNARFERLREASGRGETELGDIHPERALLEQQALAGGAGEPADITGDTLGTAAAAPEIPRGFARSQPVRVQAALLDRLVNQVGEVSIARARLDSEFETIRGSVRDLGDNLARLRAQVRDIELQADAQMAARTQAARDDGRGFDPLEFDRFTRFQELTRMMAESVDDLALVQNSLGRALQSTEDNLARQSRLTRELQRDLLRTRMVEFDSISERLYRTVRQASKDAGKPVRLDIQGGTIEIDRGVLERMAPAFEHLLRNAVAHGLEAPGDREAAGKPAVGTITLRLRHEGSEVVVSVSDDGGGLRYGDIAAKARAQGLLRDDALADPAQLREIIFQPGFSSAARTTEMAGRGVGLDVVRTDTRALGGRVDLESTAGRGTTFTLVLPLTTAVTQVVLLRTGQRIHAVPSSLVDLVLRLRPGDLDAALREQQIEHAGQHIPLYWLGALTDESGASSETPGRTLPVVLLRSAAQRLGLHVDEVLGNQEVVVKNLGPQLSRVPGLAGISVLPDGGVVLIYNPVALAAVYAEQAAARMREHAGAPRMAPVVAAPQAPTPSANTVLVVDDSITVRRVTQRFLTRNGYSVMLAKDGLDALEQLQQSLPDVVLTDIEMPRMDGFDLTRNIRADERTRHLPVIMITSRIADKHRNYAQELGVNHYLGKPYSEDELLGLLREYVLESAVD